MATKPTTVVVMLLLFVAMTCVIVQAAVRPTETETITSTTGRVNLLGLHPGSTAVEQAIYHPQAGCRCCYFNRVGGFLQCGKVCCKDGCC